jgi:hypothetical protein
MGDEEDAKLALWRIMAARMRQNARLPSGRLAGEQPGRARRFSAGGDQKDRANCTLRVRQADNRRYVSGEITRAGRSLGHFIGELADGPPSGRGKARNV